MKSGRRLPGGSFSIAFRQLRVRQWIKNLLVFAPFIFAGHGNFWAVFWGFWCFCLVSSSVYILNDIADEKSDRFLKKDRPLANREITPQFAGLLCFILGVMWTVWGLNLNLLFGFILLFYFLINSLYSLGFKDYGLVGAFMVTFGYVLRVIGGGLLAGVIISSWILVHVSAVRAGISIVSVVI